MAYYIDGLRVRHEGTDETIQASIGGMRPVLHRMKCGRFIHPIMGAGRAADHALRDCPVCFPVEPSEQ